MPGYVRFSSPVFREPAHQFKELPGGGSGLRLWQCRPQLRHHLVTHCDLNLGAGILSYVANQLRQSFPRFADGQLHRTECTSVYIGVKRELCGFQKLIAFSALVIGLVEAVECESGVSSPGRSVGAIQAYG
jgi:hypothetical protein